MHGRLKVKTTEEQQEVKRKEREKKLQFYRTATDRIFSKRQKNELDQEMLQLTSELLSANPDFSTLWNIRRELFQVWMNSRTAEELGKAFDNELYFLEQCLRMNPKSYGAWHQRSWVMDRMTNPNWKRELALCSRFLDIDERNFHCWDYRRFVVLRFGVPSESELQFTTTKISSNFSNFSSWHYRSKLLPLVYPDATQPTGVREDIVRQEFDLVQNAFFTDPNDQSAWFYHKWLLGKGQSGVKVQFVHVDRSSLIVALTRQAKLGVDFTLSLIVNNNLMNVHWSSISGLIGNVWIADLNDNTLHRGNEYSIQLSLKQKLADGEESLLEPVNLQLDSNADESYWQKSPGMLFSRELSAATSAVLSQEIESCKQLHELEPENKWVILTLLSLMRAMEPVRYQLDTISCLNKLALLDPMRTNYYSDLRSKFLMEDALENHPSTDRTFCLSGQCLTTMYHMEHLIGMTSIDLSHNCLSHLGSGHLLRCVKELSLKGNRLTNCNGMERMPRLETLDISDNEIQSVSDLVALESCPKLKTLHLSGNPIKNLLLQPNCSSALALLLPAAIC